MAGLKVVCFVLVKIFVQKDHICAVPLKACCFAQGCTEVCVLEPLNTSETNPTRLSKEFLWKIKENLYPVFTATLPIQCSQISVSRHRAPAPLTISKKTPKTLMLPG